MNVYPRWGFPPPPAASHGAKTLFSNSNLKKKPTKKTKQKNREAGVKSSLFPPGNSYFVPSTVFLATQLFHNSRPLIGQSYYFHCFLFHYFSSILSRITIPLHYKIDALVNVSAFFLLSEQTGKRTNPKSKRIQLGLPESLSR